MTNIFRAIKFVIRKEWVVRVCMWFARKEAICVCRSDLAGLLFWSSGSSFLVRISLNQHHLPMEHVKYLLCLWGLDSLANIGELPERL